MGQISVNKLTNANLYLNGNSFLGKAAELDLPEIVHKMSDHSALGMVGMSEFFSGIEKMEGKIRWNSYYPDAMATVADPTKVVEMQARASLETYSATGRDSEVAAVCFLNVAFKKLPMGNFKQHENVELESDFAVYYCRLEIDGNAVVEIDVLANIYKVNGVDITANYRANIGQ